jgi:hypothetical protein
MKSKTNKDLQDHLDYSKYHGTSGLSTKAWGPNGWYFLFSCIMGGYPVKIDERNKEHKEIKRHFKNMLLSLGYTMPCIFCRQSFLGFCKDLPVDSFMSGRIELMRWLYEIRNRVNDKLITQEEKCYNDEKKRLKNIYHNSKKTDQDKRVYYKNLEEFRTKTFITKPSVSFEEVLDKYEAIRAVCSVKAKTCALPDKK